MSAVEQSCRRVGGRLGCGLATLGAGLMLTWYDGVVHSRFRVLMLLLAFGLGLTGQVTSSAAMGAQMQGPAQAGTGALCPGCDADMQPGGMAPSCMATSCWTIPALPPQSMTLEPRPAAVYPISADAIVTGITSAPDPHPPRA